MHRKEVLRRCYFINSVSCGGGEGERVVREGGNEWGDMGIPGFLVQGIPIVWMCWSVRDKER